MLKFYIVLLLIKIKNLFRLCVLLNKYLKYFNILVLLLINPMDAKIYLDLFISSLIDDPTSETSETSEAEAASNNKTERLKNLLIDTALISIFFIYNNDNEQIYIISNS